MLASGEQGCPVAGWAQTRTVAPASGMPRELKTMSSLRVPCACAGATAQGQACNPVASPAQKANLVILDRVIAYLRERELRARVMREHLLKFVTAACAR